MLDSLEERVFIICSVRDTPPKEKEFLDNYVNNLENKGYKVYYPPRDTNQNDLCGLNICLENKEAIRNSTQVHIYWNSKSEGSRFDFGMMFMAEKPIKLINKTKIKRTPYKSFQNVLLELDSKYNLQ